MSSSEKERAAAAAADAAEAQSAPAAEGKEAADKAAKKLEGNARYTHAAVHFPRGSGAQHIVSYIETCGNGN